jgi:hypothetical protein
MGQLKMSKNGTGRRWVFIILIIFALFGIEAGLVYYFKEYDPRYIREDILGDSIGTLFATTIIPLIISISAKFFKRSFTGVFLTTLLVISIPLFLITTYGKHYNRYSENKKQGKEVNKAITGVEKEFLKLIDSAKDKTDVPKRIESKIDTKPKTEGAIGIIERFMKEYMAQMIAIRNDHLLEIEAIGWNSILDLKRLKQDLAFTESKFMLKRGKEITKKYREKTISFMENETKQNMAKMNIKPSLKERMISGYNEGLPPAMKDVHRQWDLEEKILIEFEKIINLLSRRKGYWEFNEKKIYFKNDSDLNNFNTCIATIQRYVEEQQKLQSQGVQDVKNKFQRLKERLQ